MIYGIGTDICDIRRIRASLERHGDRFAEKVLATRELAVGRAAQRWPDRGLRYLATRFSAKEAFSKAIGLGMRMPMTWRACEVAKLPSGQPVIVLHGALQAWFEARRLSAQPQRDRRGRLRCQLLRGRRCSDPRPRHPLKF